MLWALDPVKYWQAAPNGGGGKELLLPLLPESAELPALLALEGRPQILQVSHPQLAPEAEQGLGTQAGDLAELHEIRRVLAAQLLELRDGPGLEELTDLLRGAHADPVDRGQLLFREGHKVAPAGGDCFHRVLVGPGPERIWRALVQHRELGHLSKEGHQRIASSRLPWSRSSTRRAGLGMALRPH